MAQRNQAQGESAGESLKELAADLALLLREDLEAARGEMLEKAKAAGTGAGLLTGSALTGLLTLFSLTVLLMAALASIVQPWVAALSLTLFWALITAILAFGAKQKIAEAGPPMPERAIAHLKADIRAAKEGMDEASNA